jgi:aldose sugar dehydrogenase
MRFSQVLYSKFAIITIVISFFGANAQALGVRGETVARGLQNPWAVAFLPDGRFLVTEKPGRLRVIDASGNLLPAVTGMPAIAAGGQGGLLDLLLDTDFATNRTLYFCFSEPAPPGSANSTANSTALARARLSADATRLEDVKIIFSQKPKVASSAHFGCRIVEGRAPGTGGKADGLLYMTLGDRYIRKDDAQKLDNHLGKVVRIRKDGTVPADNPFNNAASARSGALPEIWSYGHRNMQGAVLAPDGALWTHEHGAQGGDEINIVQPGRNYGWPVITHGENYGGGKIGEGITSKPGLEQPLHYWVPSIAPSGMVFLTSERYGKDWVGNLFAGSLKFGYLDRIELSEPFKGRVVREHKLLTGQSPSRNPSTRPGLTVDGALEPMMPQRIRDVRQGPDGLLYVLTDQSEARLIRLLPD